ncbi:hypothetical protein MW887_006917 [Aspergillus wentii]|nr:hypothetical protein MW887_006917 [Aspergillus wentii]
MQRSTAFSPWGSLDGRSIVQKKNARSDNGYDAMPQRRNPLACEMCYKKKIKCEVEGSNPACIQCLRRNVRCKFTTRKEKKENTRRTQYIKNLEERLRQAEAVLKAAGILDDEILSQGELTDDDDELSENDSEVEDEQDDEDTDYPANGSFRNGAQVPVLKLNDKEDSRYYGRSSFLSILSREGIEWIKDKTGDVSFLRMLFSESAHDSPWDYWRPDVFHDLFASKVFKPLPPRAEVFTLLRDYFRTVNRLFPVYHEESFMQLVEWQYTQQTCNDAARWASINIILSLAYEYRFSNSLKPEKDRERAWLYYKNAMSVYAELTMRRTDLLSVQALLGMALFLRGNSGTQSALPIVTAAIRSCHRMGLHRNIPRPYLPAVEQEQRKRVFWIAYIMDQSTCIRAGNAPAQHSDDFDVDLPTDNTADGCPVGNNTSFFRQLCRLTVIKSRIYGKLYSAKALHNKSPVDVIGIVEELHAELEDWRVTSPFDSHVKQKGAGEDFLLGFASVGLQFVYYNSLIMIHRMPLIINFAYATHAQPGLECHFDPRVLNRQSSISNAYCVQAARDTLRLVNNMPWGDIAWIWSLLYYVFLAVMTIFVAILRDSKHPNAREDLQSLNMAATFFATLIPGEGACHYATFMARMCANFERIARSVLERDEKAITRHSSVNSHSSNEKPPRALSKRANPKDSLGANRRSQSLSSPSNSGHAASLDIPHLEGLPRINSSGYFVPESPDTASEDLPSSTNRPLHNTALQNPPTTTTATTPADLSNPTTRHIARGYNNQPSSYNPMFPGSTFSSTAENTTPTEATPPELWQVPVTADWEFGGQFLGSLITHGLLEQDPLITTMGSMVPGPVDMGFPFGDQSQNQNLGQDPGSNDASSLWSWPGMFMGPF